MLVCAVLAVVAAWIVVARDARLYIDSHGGVTQYIEMGDEIQLPGPMLEFPDSDLPLIHQNMHAVPLLFRWSVDRQAGQAPVATVDWRGHLRAANRGIVDVWVHARGGTAKGTARFEVIPRLDTIHIHLSRDTVRLGDTVTVSYVAVEAGGTPMAWYGAPNEPSVDGDWDAVRRVTGDARDRFAYVAVHRGTAIFRVQLGKRAASAAVTVR